MNESDFYAVDGQLHTALKLAVAGAASIENDERRAWALRGIASLLVGTPETFKVAAFELCPELVNVEPIPDTHLNIEEHAIASRLTPSDMQLLDGALVAGADLSWRNIERVVGLAMVELQGQMPTLPLGIYVQRIAVLVQNGIIEAQGNTAFMRLSEVRLTTRSAGAA
jgi:hypothetical protein